MITFSIGPSSNTYVLKTNIPNFFQNQAKAAQQDTSKIGPPDKKDEEDKRLQVPNTSSAVRGTTQIPPRTGTSGIQNPPRRKVNPAVAADRSANDGTPDTTRAMGGSDRLLRSQSKTQGGGGGVVPGPTASRSQQQQNWY